MNKKINLVCFFVFFLLSCVSKADVSSLDINKSDFYIPSTISEEAKKFLSTFKEAYKNIKNLPERNDREKWKIFKSKYIGYVKNINIKVLKDFDPIIIEKMINGVKITEIIPKNWNKKKKVIVYLHGGAYTLFTSSSSLYNSVPIAHYSGIRVLSIDYTTAPSSKWNDTTNEVMSVFKQLFKDGYDAGSIGVLGDSAGGGLAVASILKLRNEGNSIPKVLALWSPWVDLTGAGDSYQTLKVAEPTFSYPSLLKHSADAYADDVDKKNKYASPIYGNFEKGFCVTLIQGGTKELLLSDFIRLYQKMDTSGVDVKLDIYEGLWHVFQSNYSMPESIIAIKKTAKFFNKHLN